MSERNPESGKLAPWKRWKWFGPMTRAKAVVVLAALFFVTNAVFVAADSMGKPGSCGPDCTRYDVVVIGSEVPGVLLAKAAREQGLRVVILDPREKPGGELIQGQMQVLDEPNDNRKRSLVQGEFKKLFDAYKAGTVRKHEDFERYFQRWIRGITLHSGIAIQSVEIVTAGTELSIRSLTYRNRNGRVLTVQARYWVENTDFNALTGRLGVKRIPGMESLYNGKKPDYMAATYMIKLKKVNWAKLHRAILDDYPLRNVQQKYGPNTYVDWNFATGFSNLMTGYKPQDEQLRLRGLNITNQKNGEVIINGLLIYDVDPADPVSVATAIRKGRAEAPRVLAHLRKHLPGFEKAELNGFPEYLYIRDYNRFETKYVLNERDVKEGRMFWDNVSIGGYAMDLQGTRAIPLGIGFGKPDRYGIPLRSFQLKEYDNVLVVGKNIGATIKAYGSARIMATTALAAETIGILLGRETHENKRLSDLTPADFRRFHAYLEKYKRIVLTR